jgi:ABC-type transport system involved in multi-copper enzyme maturation permease subunit
MESIWNRLTRNPIVANAFRHRRVGWQLIAAFFLAMLAYCPTLMGAGSFLTTLLSLDLDLPLGSLSALGQFIFYPTTLILLVLVTLFAPVLAVGAIAGERQRQTLSLLLITLLPAHSIVRGKLVSALIYLGFMIAVVWPLILVGAVVGRVDAVELLVATLLLGVTALAFTSIGLFVSSRSKTITNATMLTYGVVLPAFLIGPFLGMLLVTIILAGVGSGDDLLAYGWSFAASFNPLTAAIVSYVMYDDGGGFILAETTPDQYILHPWLIYLGFYAFITWLLLHLAVRRLEEMNEV